MNHRNINPPAPSSPAYPHISCATALDKY